MYSFVFVWFAAFLYVAFFVSSTFWHRTAKYPYCLLLQYIFPFLSHTGNNAFSTGTALSGLLPFGTLCFSCQVRSARHCQISLYVVYYKYSYCRIGNVFYICLVACVPRNIVPGISLGMRYATVRYRRTLFFRGSSLNAFTTGNPCLEDKLLRISREMSFGAQKELYTSSKNGIGERKKRLDISYLMNDYTAYCRYTTKTMFF